MTRRGFGQLDVVGVANRGLAAACPAARRIGPHVIADAPPPMDPRPGKPTARNRRAAVASSPCVPPVGGSAASTRGKGGCCWCCIEGGGPAGRLLVPGIEGALAKISCPYTSSTEPRRPSPRG